MRLPNTNFTTMSSTSKNFHITLEVIEPKKRNPKRNPNVSYCKRRPSEKDLMVLQVRIADLLSDSLLFKHPKLYKLAEMANVALCDIQAKRLKFEII